MPNRRFENFYSFVFWEKNPPAPIGPSRSKATEITIDRGRGDCTGAILDASADIGSNLGASKKLGN